MSSFVCPVEGCTTHLSRLQVMHFRSSHDCDPAEWVSSQFGSAIKELYAAGKGSYTIAEKYEWLTPDMVVEIVETRSHEESLTGGTNPMRREGVVEDFVGEANPAKASDVREKISEALMGHTLDDAAKQKISRKNSGNTISEEHRNAISEASSAMDRSYMQTEEYSQALSEALQGRDPTYPTPYSVDELTHQVRSSWEEAVGRLLYENDVEYRYEPEFEVSSGSYYPDFVTAGSAIEVKGWANERSVRKAEQFLELYPSLTYIVVGDDLPCDIHIPWEEKSRLIEVLDNE